MKVFTVEEGDIVVQNAKVETIKLKAGISIPAIVIGEEGRGRSLGVLPVQLSQEQYIEWQKEGKVSITSASLVSTKADKPKLDSTTDNNNDKVICVLRSPIGFRGNNEHTGDRCGWLCDSWSSETGRCTAEGSEMVKPDVCPVCGSNSKGYGRYGSGPKNVFDDWPGEDICTGSIAQGTAGKMGSGTQLVSIIPANVICRVYIGGRRYGAPSAYYYTWTGSELLVATWREREISDIF